MGCRRKSSIQAAAVAAYWNPLGAGPVVSPGNGDPAAHRFLPVPSQPQFEPAGCLSPRCAREGDSGQSLAGGGRGGRHGLAGAELRGKGGLEAPGAEWTFRIFPELAGH